MPAGLLRRLAAIVYDGLLLLGLLMVVTMLFLPLTGGEALTAASHPALEWLYRAALAASVYAYYAIPWTRRGQTLGMSTWRIRVEREDGRRLGWRDCALRLAAAAVSWLAFGLGWLWALVDAERRTWHDQWTRTRTVLTGPARAARP